MHLQEINFEGDPRTNCLALKLSYPAAARSCRWSMRSSSDKMFSQESVESMAKPLQLIDSPRDSGQLRARFSHTALAKPPVQNDPTNVSVSFHYLVKLLSFFGRSETCNVGWKGGDTSFNQIFSASRRRLSNLARVQHCITSRTKNHLDSSKG